MYLKFFQHKKEKKKKKGRKKERERGRERERERERKNSGKQFYAFDIFVILVGFQSKLTRLIFRVCHEGKRGT